MKSVQPVKNLTPAITRVFLGTLLGGPGLTHGNNEIGQLNKGRDSYLLDVAFCTFYFTKYWCTGIRGLMRGIATLPQGYQELSVVRDKVGRPPGELGVSKSMECDIFPSVL